MTDAPTPKLTTARAILLENLIYRTGLWDYGRTDRRNSSGASRKVMRDRMEEAGFLAYETSSYSGRQFAVNRPTAAAIRAYLAYAQSFYRSRTAAGRPDLVSSQLEYLRGRLLASTGAEIAAAFVEGEKAQAEAAEMKAYLEETQVRERMAKAAPDLLQALRKAESRWEGLLVKAEMTNAESPALAVYKRQVSEAAKAALTDVRAAIAKAEGRAQ